MQETQKNTSLAALLVPDRIHPSEASHWVMAAALARTWGVSPIISSVEIDAAVQKRSQSRIRRCRSQGGEKNSVDADRQGPAAAIVVGRCNDSVCSWHLRIGRNGSAVASCEWFSRGAIHAEDRWEEHRFISRGTAIVWRQSRSLCHADGKPRRGAWTESS